VNVALDDQLAPEEVVVLQFIAPQEMLEALVEELVAGGMDCSIHRIIPGFLTRCQLERKRR